MSNIYSKTTRPTRGGNRISQSPPCVKALSNGAAIQTQPISPNSGRQPLAIECDESSGPSIAGLLGTGCPTTILFRVIAVVVNSFKLMFRRGPFAHVGKKSIERKPSLAHLNASLAVVSEVGSIRVNTPGLHRSPDVILGLSRLSVPAAATSTQGLNRPHALSGFLPKETPARASGAGSQMVQEQRFRVTAIADASHNPPSVGRAMLFNCSDSEAPENKADQFGISSVMHYWFRYLKSTCGVKLNTQFL